jgi:urocanate hydratase
VTSTGAEVTNPDGLTVGQTFDADLQGGCLLFDGINLTAQCTIGNVNINSTVGSIYSDALENIGSTAGIGIGLTAGEGIIADAVQDVALIAGAMITQDATTVQVTAASAFDVQAASNITLLSGGPVSLDGASVTINGAIISLN